MNRLGDVPGRLALVALTQALAGCGGEPDTTSATEPDPEPEVPCEAVSTGTSNLAVGGTPTASHQTTDTAAKAFDDNTGTNWRSQNPLPWLAYEFPEEDAHAVTTYTIAAASGGVNGSLNSDPSSWEFQGSDAGVEESDWTTLDTRVDEKFEGRYHMRSFSFSNTTSYHRYRLLITQNGGGAELRVAELALFADGEPAFSVDNAMSGDGDSQFNFSARWSGHTVDNASERYNGSSSWCNVPDEVAQVSFVGSQISLYAIKDLAHGILAISVDGGRETEVDLYGPLAFNQLFFTSKALCPGPHILQARVTGKKNPASTDVFVSLDRVQILP